jgi:molybdenum cofactor synthesis domain-containing protein
MEIQFGIITVSDRASQGIRPDLTGPALKNIIQENGWYIKRYKIVPDDISILSSLLSSWADQGDMDIILTAGGTGLSPRDITPEATLRVIDRLAPGIPEAMRATSNEKTPHAMLSRGVAGIRNNALVINLPGSPKAAEENFLVVLPVLTHAVQLLSDHPGSEEGHSF